MQETKRDLFCGTSSDQGTVQKKQHTNGHSGICHIENGPSHILPANIDKIYHLTQPKSINQISDGTCNNKDKVGRYVGSGSS
jgi:hypothetical protein